MIDFHKTVKYIKELENNLDSFESEHEVLHFHYNSLNETIQKLMDSTYKLEDKQQKAIHSALELKARNCLKIIESRLALKN